MKYCLTLTGIERTQRDRPRPSILQKREVINPTRICTYVILLEQQNIHI